MNRKLLNGLLVVAVATSGAVTFTSCKDEDFRMNAELADLAAQARDENLQAQIDAIRNSQEQLFNDWLNDLTSLYSDGEFEDYEAMVQAATKMWDIYQSILSDTLSPEAEEYVAALYDWIFNKHIQQSAWYNLIYQLAERATSVELNQVKNPVFGTVNIPLGIKNEILASYLYYGDQYSFPSGILAGGKVAGSSTNNLTPDLISALQSLKPTDVKLGESPFTDNGENGNMGTAVVTINPSSNAYTNPDVYTVELINSKGEVAFSNAKGFDKGTLSLSEYDDLLTFGASRAGEPGLYAIDVNANPANYDYLMVDLNKSGIKDALKEVMNKKSVSSIAHLGETVINTINSVNLPAYAVKVSWEEDEVDQATGESTGNTITNSVTSSYGLAAAVVKPLSYGLDIAQFLPSGKSLPVIHNSLSEYLEKLGNKLHVSFQIDELDSDIDIEFNVVIKDGYVEFWVYDENGDKVEAEPIKIEYTGAGINASTADLNALVKAIQDAMSMELSSGIQYKMIKQLNDAISQVNDKIKDIEKKANDYLDRLKNSSKLDYAQKLLDIYNDFAKRANNLLKNPNHYLQAVMGYTFGDGAHFLPNDPKMPLTVSKANGNLDVIVTSYTGDVLIPSYKKYVAITGVVANNSVSTNGIAAYNTGDLNKVLSGTTEKVQVNLSAIPENTVVRLTYISVDYDGVCSMENGYVKVVK